MYGRYRAAILFSRHPFGVLSHSMICEYPDMCMHVIVNFAIVLNSSAMKPTPNVTILMKYIKYFIDKYTLHLRGATTTEQTVNKCNNLLPGVSGKLCREKG